jgi:hypothetical protein
VATGLAVTLGSIHTTGPSGRTFVAALQHAVETR